MIKISSKGNFSKTESFLKRTFNSDIRRVLSASGREGVTALAAATPADSGETSSSWDFEVTTLRGSSSIVWTNSHTDSSGVPIVIMLQYGHGTGTGGYVQGRDFINPAVRPVFDRIADDVWKAVTSA